MTSAAERYAEAKLRAQRDKTLVGAFIQEYPFELDPFQLEACAAIDAGRGVLVAAPTGSGKTVVGEFAIFTALHQGKKCFYTTPIKALSNQKFAELSARYGERNIGLLTGDNSINSEAPIVVMTTEVLRNMLYSGSSTLNNLAFVVMDEVHYLADRSRGAVWEEVIIHLPESVSVVALSATVSNAEEFGQWLATLRGATDVVVEEHRPVPLWQHVMAGQQLYDLFIDPGQLVVNPELVSLTRLGLRNARQRSDRHDRRNQRSSLTPKRYEVIERLEREHLLPAIYFLFSRAGCEDAVEQILRSGLRLTDSTERHSIKSQVLELTRDLPDDDLIALGFDSWLDGLERGVAAHHAGLLPRFKEIVESLFQQGLLKVVFATETLALGINMPARSVVLERLVKWNGEAHVDLSPGEYTQLTGRAGRRGIDIEGHAVVLWQNDLDPKILAGLASTRTYPLKSSFRPSYNMAVNLVGTIGASRARELLETSFAQFQADRSVVGLANELRKLEEARDGYREAMQCHLGDFDEYARIRHQIGLEEKSESKAAVVHRRAGGIAQLKSLKQGDVVLLSSGKKSGPAVVITAAHPKQGEEPRPLVLTSDRQIRRLNHHDGLHDLTPIGRVRVPKHFTSKDHKLRKSLAAQVRNIASEVPDTNRRLAKTQRQNPTIQDMRDQLKMHPCHGCADREAHARWGERFHKVQGQINEVHGRMQGRTNTISKRFDRLCEVLGRLNYLEVDAENNWRVTSAGGVLKGIYSEADLLIAQCIRLGILDHLDPPALAAVCSAFLYESRGSDYEDSPSVPGGPTEQAIYRITDVWGEIAGVENDYRLPGMRRIDAGLAWAIYRWAKGASLMKILTSNDVTAGDFVRWVRQVIDLLSQIVSVTDVNSELHVNAIEAVAQLQRGVVSYASTA